ncbi:hypothetical protein J2X69_002662 [Algoriphagus sp. 4150]|nr:hypothetical protein [Algoriphagus sp. 4150]MDR7130312.1 hypothetical protein [Algoriphagus sp. 4150]
MSFSFLAITVFASGGSSLLGSPDATFNIPTWMSVETKAESVVGAT